MSFNKVERNTNKCRLDKFEVQQSNLNDLFNNPRLKKGDGTVASM